MKKLAIILITLALLDIGLTLVGLSLGASEGNPLMQLLITTWWGIALKLFLTCGVAIYCYKRKGKLALWLANGLMLLVVLNNAIPIAIYYYVLFTS
jgi:hypothetical protein